MKKIIRNRFTILILLGALLVSCRHDYSQSHTLTDLSEVKGSAFRALYFYPTTIRMLSRVFGDSTATALKEIKSGRVFFTFSDENDSIKARFKTLQIEIQNEGFENLMKLKSPTSQMAAYMKDSEIPDYVIFMLGENGYLIIEMSGKLSPAGLREISTLDLAKAAEMFDLIPEKEEAPVDSIQIPNPKPVQ